MYLAKQNKAATLMGLLSIIFGAIGISGWEFDFVGWEKIFPGLIYIKFNTALCYILLGLALIFIQKENNRYNRLLFFGFTLLFTLITSLSFSEYVFHFNAGIDQLFVHDFLAASIKYPFPGRMYPQVAIGLMLQGFALLGFTRRNFIVNSISQYLLHFISLITAVVIVGYLYHFSFFSNVPFESALVLFWAVFSFFLSVFTSFLRPDIGIISLFRGNLIGNKIASRLFIIMALVIIIFGLIKRQSLGFRFSSVDAGLSFLAISLLLISLAIIWNTANWLNRIDLKRYEAEEEIKAINEKLEQRVEERTAELRELLEKFQESESKFRSAFEFSPIGVGLIALDGKCLKVNKRWIEMLGYSENELLSMTFLDITHPEDLDLHVDLMRRALETDNKVFQFEKRYVKKNGDVLWASVNFTVIRDNNGAPMYFITQIADISERKKAEQAQMQIIENEEKLRTLFNNVEGATSLLDTEMRLIVFNNVFSEKQAMLNGVAPKVGDELYGFLLPEEKKQRMEIVSRVLKGNRETFEVTYVRGGKPLYFRISFAPVIVDGKVTAISSYSINLTDTRDAEDKMRKADARFRAIVENVFVGIKLNDKDWNIIYRSPSMQAINGWSDDEFQQRYLELVHPDDLESLIKIQQEVLLNPNKPITIIYRILRKNGSYVWIESMFCNRLTEPDLGATIVVTRDINERKLIEDKLIKSEEKYRTLVEHASDAIYLIDYEGNFTDVNESMCQMTGYTKDELLKLTIDQIIEPEQLKTDPVKHGPMRTDAAVIRERRFVSKTGRVFDVEINVKQFGDDSVLVIARDITQRKQMENELRGAELKFRTLAEKSMVGVYIIQNGRLIYANPRFGEIFGYGPQELVNISENPVDILFNEKDRGFIRKKIQNNDVGQAASDNFEINGNRKDGTVNRVEFYGSRLVLDGVPTIIGTVLDITQRAKAEEVLKRSEANLKTIMDTTDSVYVLLDKELNIAAYNQMAVHFASEQFDISPEINNQFIKYFPEKEIPQSLLNPISQFYNGRFAEFKLNADKVLKGENVSYEVNYPKPDGSPAWFFIRLFPIINDHKEIFGLLLKVTDITERKNSEENLKSAYSRIQEHIDSIKEMTWKQSHLIRGPLANLKALARILQDNPSDGESLNYLETELERLDNVLIEMETSSSINQA